MTAIPGIHHVTAISGPAQANVDFFTGVLRQRLVKKTVNFDAPDTYHLYYGDAAGTPGTIMTFFPFAGAAPGRAGPGMAQAYAYAVPPATFAAFAARADGRGAEDRFGAPVLTLHDPDGAPVELIETPEAPDAHGFHSVTLWERDPEPTGRLLTDVFGYALQGAERGPGVERLRFAAPGAGRGSIIDILRRDGTTRGVPGAGTIHHVAFRARNREEQLGWMERLAAIGRPTTPVIDRQYFKSIYFREPGGVLFEIATDPPGFAVDEDPSALGQALKLPPQHEPLRAELERRLPPLKVTA